MNNQAAQTMPELPPSFARVHNDGYWTLRVRDTAEFIVHDSRQTPAQEVYSSGQMRDMYQQGYAAALSQTAGVPEGPLSGKYGDVLRPFVVQMERELHANAGKALHAHASGNVEKAEHHIITTAAALANWHLSMFGGTDMRPGIDGEAAMTAASGMGGS